MRIAFLVGWTAFIPKSDLGVIVEGRSELYPEGCASSRPFSGLPPVAGNARDSLGNWKLMNPGFQLSTGR
jgi:hypothetical protein